MPSLLPQKEEKKKQQDKMEKVAKLQREHLNDITLYTYCMVNRRLGHLKEEILTVT